MTGWLLVAVTFICLVAFWHFLNWVLDLIGQALRDQEWR